MKFKYTILFWHLKFNFNKLQHTLKPEQKEGPILQGLLPFSTIIKSNKIYRQFYKQKRIEKFWNLGKIIIFFCLLPGLFIFEENVNIFLRYKNPTIFSITACYKNVKFLEKTFLITLFNVSCRRLMTSYVVVLSALLWSLSILSNLYRKFTHRGIFEHLKFCFETPIKKAF